MCRRSAVVGLAALALSVLAACEPEPVPTGFGVTPVGGTTASTEQHVLTRAADGALWTAGMADAVDRFDPSTGLHATVVLPGEGTAVMDLLPGPAGSVLVAAWSSDGYGWSGDGRVLRIEADLSVHTVLELGAEAVPGGLAHDGLSGFWVSDGTGDRILRSSFDGGLVEVFDLPEGVGPTALVATGPDTVRFVPAFAPGLGLLDAVTGAVEVDPNDAAYSLAVSFSLIVGPDGKLWYTRLGSHGMFRFDPDTGTTEEIDGSELWPRELAVGADGGVYATLMCGLADGLARVDPATLEVTTFDIGLSSDRGTALGSIVRDGPGFWAVGHPSAGFLHLDPAAP